MMTSFRARRPIVFASIIAAAMAAGSVTLAQSSALRIGTSSVGSIFYTLAVGLSKMMESHAKIPSTAEAVGGSHANMFALQADRVDLAISNASAAFDARRGTEPFRGPIDVRLIAQGQPSFRQIIVRVGSGIEKPEDLAGKTIIGRRPALPEVGQITEALLKVYGIDPGRVNIVSTTETGEAINAVNANTVDAVVIPGSLNASYLQQLSHDRKITFLDIPDDKAKAMMEHLPGSIALTKIPANSYQGQDRAVNTFSINTYLVAAARVPEDEVYRATRALFENLDEFHTLHSAARQWTLDRTLDDPRIPFHPGAIRYFKEKGAWTAELESAQKSLER